MWSKKILDSIQLIIWVEWICQRHHDSGSFQFFVRFLIGCKTAQEVKSHISPFCWDSFSYVCVLFLSWNNTKHSGYRMSCYLARDAIAITTAYGKTQDKTTRSLFSRLDFFLFTFFCVSFFFSFWSNSKGGISHTKTSIYVEAATECLLHNFIALSVWSIAYTIYTNAILVHRGLCKRLIRLIARYINI